MYWGEGTYVHVWCRSYLVLLARITDTFLCACAFVCVCVCGEERELWRRTISHSLSHHTGIGGAPIHGPTETLLLVDASLMM